MPVGGLQGQCAFLIKATADSEAIQQFLHAFGASLCRSLAFPMGVSLAFDAFERFPPRGHSALDEIAAEVPGSSAMWRAQVGTSFQQPGRWPGRIAG